MSARWPAAGVGLRDALAVAMLAALVWWYAATFLDFSRHPEEDAAMLLRYARHLAQGHGVVWNVGERPVDGATDVLFMAAVAALNRVGLGLEASARVLGITAHALTVLLVYGAVRALFGTGTLVALVPAAYLALGTGLHYVTACYGTTLFALTVAVAWVLAWRTAVAPAGDLRRRAMGLGLCSVLMGVARPEGALLGVLFLAGALVAREGRDRVALLAGFWAGFLVPGLAYFAWRWSYFGYPLPNPFYRKSGGVLHADVLARSVRNVVRLGGPFLAVLVAGLGSARTRRTAGAALLPVAGFAALWVLVSDETNYFMRFRYPILPVVLIAWVPVAQALAARLWFDDRLRRGRIGRLATALAALAVAFGLAAWQHRRFGQIQPQRMGLFDVAVMLRPYAGKGYTLATTEAGLLPLYSDWRAVDAWGLNDAWIAHHRGLTEEYLDRYRPEVIAFHAYYSPAAPPDEADTARRGLGPSWFATVKTLQRYAEGRGYTLAAVFGRDAADAHYYYVRPGFAESATLAAGIRGMRYLWNGQPAENYAPPSPPERAPAGGIIHGSR